MACGGGKQKKIVLSNILIISDSLLDKQDLFDFALEFPGGCALKFSKETSNWKNSTKPSAISNQPPIQPQPEPSKEVKQPEIEINTVNTLKQLEDEPLPEFDEKAEEEKLKKEKDNLEQKKATLITNIEARKDELQKLLLLVQEHEQNAKKNKKESLITEIKNEILINMTIKQNDKYEKIVKEIQNRV